MNASFSFFPPGSLLFFPPEAAFFEPGIILLCGMERCALTQLHHPFIYCHHHHNKLEEENAFCAALGFFSASFPFWVFSFSISSNVPIFFNFVLSTNFVKYYC